MDERRCLTIADRIDVLLQREIGQGIEFDRMMRDHLYRRDVLLVCDAYPGHELARLAQEFRAALAEDLPVVGARRSGASGASGVSGVPGGASASRPSGAASTAGASDLPAGGGARSEPPSSRNGPPSTTTGPSSKPGFISSLFGAFRS